MDFVSSFFFLIHNIFIEICTFVYTVKLALVTTSTKQ